MSDECPTCYARFEKGQIHPSHLCMPVSGRICTKEFYKQAPAFPVPGCPKPDGGGLRYNAGKNRIDLLPPEWTWALGDVTTKGSYKYEERNWERGMKWSIMVGCASRHVLKFLVGERYDRETGCHHLAMAAWNILALMSYDLRGIGENNLPGVPKFIATGEGKTLLDLVNNGDPQHPKIREAMGLPPVEK